MSFQAMTWAVKQELPTNQKMVLIMLANRTNQDTGRCDPSLPRLAADCGMSLRTLKRCLEALEQSGLITIERRESEYGQSKTHQYTLSMGKTAQGGAQIAGDAGLPGAQDAQGGKTAQGGAQNCTKEGRNLHPKPLYITKNKPKRASAREKFVPPTVEQVAEYCEKRQNGIDPQAFVDHYSANGWKRGKTEIKDWQACVRTWEARRREDSAADVGYHGGVFYQ